MRIVNILSIPPCHRSFRQLHDSYISRPTKANASAFITRALEENWLAVQQSAAACGYIATRPRAERLGDHGLLGDEDGVGLERAMGELDHYVGNV